MGSKIYFLLFGIAILCSCSTGPQLIISEDIETLKSKVEFDPNNKMAHYNLGIGYLSIEDYQSAEKQFKEVLKRDNQFAQAHFASYITGFLADEELFRESTKDEPDSLLMIKIDSLNNHLEQALIYDPFIDWGLATLLLQPKPKYFSVDAQYLYDKIYGVLYEGFEKFFTNKYKEAIECFNNTLEIIPDYTQAKLFRSYSYIKIGDYEAAVTDLDSLVIEKEDLNKNKLLPVYFEVTDLFYALGMVYLQNNNLDKAEEMFMKVILEDMSFYMAHFQLSVVKQKRRRYRDALEELDAAVLIESNDDLLQYNRAYFLSQLNKIDMALEGYDKVIDLNPYNYKAYFNRAFLYEKKKDFSKAKENYKKFLENVPLTDEHLIKLAKEKISSL